jgi:hypothetical protein
MMPWNRFVISWCILLNWQMYFTIMGTNMKPVHTRFKYFIVKDGTSKKNHLSLQTCIALTEDELRCYVVSWAETHQCNPDTLAIFVESYQGDLIRYASYAEQNKGVK